MKILFHISSLFGGGAERVVSNLVNYNCQLGNSVIVVVCYEKENEYEIDSRSQKIVIGQHNILKQSSILRKIIKKEKPNISIGFMQGGNVRITLAHLFLRSPYLISVRNDPNQEYPSFLSKIFAKLFFRKSSGVVFQTKDAMNFFSTTVKKKSTVIANPVSKIFFGEKIHDEGNGIVAVGRLVEQKNYPLLIQAYKDVKDNIEDNLYIYGDGPLNGKLTELIKKEHLDNRVYLMGRTNDIPSVLRKSKIFVMSSDYEGMPNSLLEAYCVGVPCISTDCPCGGPRSILIKNSGILVPTNDQKALSDAIMTLCTDKSNRSAISSASLKERSRFDTETILKEWDSFISSKI